MNIINFVKGLPPVVQILVALGVLILIIVIIGNRDAVENLIHLLQAFPPIIWIPINTAAKLPRDEEATAANTPQTEKLPEL